MIITVLSGKGGTGKTTVATNLALSLANTQLLDADVEEPNSAIFINAEFSDRSEAVIKTNPVIEQSKCIACRQCVEFCQYNALALLGKQLLVFPEICHSCGGCIMVCPTAALTEGEREIGRIRADQSNRNPEFWQGELNIGEETAVPVIVQLKQHRAEDKTVIIDAQPGSSCPTIAAALDSDFCLLVTEPTPFGLNDLKMAVEMVKELGIPAGIIINRSEEEYDYLIAEYAQSEGLALLLKIPFDREIAFLYSKGIPFTEKQPEWRAKFRQLYANIEGVVQNAADNRN